jgi:hypothetical protein
MGPDTIAAMLSRSPSAGAVLARIPAGVSLVDQDADIDEWQALRDLFRAFEGLSGRTPSPHEEVLHKKRPALIPILDSISSTDTSSLSTGRSQAVSPSAGQP